MKTPVEFTSMNEAQDFVNAIMANRAIVIAASGSASSRNSGGGASNRLYTRPFPTMRLTKAHACRTGTKGSLSCPP